MARFVPIFPLIERGLALNETIRSMVREEARLASCDGPRPEETGVLMDTAGNRLVETAREITRLSGPLSETGASGLDGDEDRLLAELREAIEETMGMIREASRTIRETRNEVLGEITRANRADVAVRAYRNARTYH